MKVFGLLGIILFLIYFSSNSIASLLILIVIAMIIYYNHKNIMKRFFYYAIISLTLSTLSLLFREFYILNFINSGLVGFSMYYIIMSIALFDRKNNIVKRFVSVRTEISILAFIFISPHAILRLLIDIDIFGIIAYVIMIPLTILSFNIIKKEISLTDWKRIHKASYFVYLVIFIHLINVADTFDKVIYAILGTLYINNRIIKWRDENEKTT